MTDRDKLRGALTNVLANASNYPEAVQPHILGRGMGPLIEKATDAVMELPVETVDPEALYDVIEDAYNDTDYSDPGHITNMVMALLSGKGE